MLQQLDCRMKSGHTDCPICLQRYDSRTHRAEKHCQNNHEICEECLNHIIVSGLPKKCPQCRAELKFPSARLRKAIDARLQNIWSVRRRDQGERLPDLPDASIEVHRQPMLLVSHQNVHPSIGNLLPIALTSLVQWVNIILNLYYLLRQNYLYPLILLYLPILLLYHFIKVQYRQQSLKRVLANQLLLPNFSEEGLFTPFYNVFLYVMPLIIGGLECYIEFKVNEEATALGIVTMMSNIFILILCIRMSSRVADMLDVTEQLSETKWIKVPVVAIFILYGYVEFGLALYVLAMSIVAAFGFLLGLTVIMVVVGCVVLKYKGVNRNWRGVYIVANMSTPYTAVEQSGRLLIVPLAGMTFIMRHIICPILLGWLYCKESGHTQRITITQLAFAMSLLSLFSASWGQLCYRWLLATTA